MVEIRRVIFQGGGLSFKHYVIEMMPIDYIVRKVQEKKQPPNVHGQYQTIYKVKNYRRI